MCRLYGKFASYLRRVLCKTRLIFPRINGPTVLLMLNLELPINSISEKRIWEAYRRCGRLDKPWAFTRSQINKENHNWALSSKFQVGASHYSSLPRKSWTSQFLWLANLVVNWVQRIFALVYFNMDHNKHVCSTLQKRSCGTEAKIIGSIVVTFPNLTSGMYSAQTTCAQPVNTYKKLLEGNLNTYNCTFVCRHNNVLIMHKGQSEYKGFHVERYIWSFKAW